MSKSGSSAKEKRDFWNQLHNFFHLNDSLERTETSFLHGNQVFFSAKNPVPFCPMKISTRSPYHQIQDQSIFCRKYLGSKVESGVTPGDEIEHTTHVSQIPSFCCFALKHMNDKLKDVDEHLDESNLLHMNDMSKDVDELLDIEEGDNESEGGDREDESSAAKANEKTVEPNKDDKSTEDDDGIHDSEGGVGDSEDKEDESSIAKSNADTLGTKMKHKSKEGDDERLDFEADDNESEGCDRKDESSAAKVSANAKMSRKSTEGSDERLGPEEEDDDIDTVYEQDNTFNQAGSSWKRPAASPPSASQQKTIPVQLHMASGLIEYLKEHYEGEKKALVEQLESDMLLYFTQLEEQVKKLEAEKVESDEESDYESCHPLMRVFDDFGWP